MSGKGTFTLYYFNAMGRAEPVRWMFAFSKTPFTDQRYAKEEWPAQKAKMPLGQLPVLDFTGPDGKKMTMCQSGSIIRFVAKAVGLGGQTPEEQARADEAFESIKELQDALGKAFYETDPEKKEQLMKQAKTETAPRILGFLEKRLKENGGKFLAGTSGYTFPDIYLASLLNQVSMHPEGSFDLAAACPGIAGHVKKIFDAPEIKAYLEKRPKTER